ncbi:MAG: hypothetical protein ABI318_19040 [Chthoniobacteraceae bacterium]
MAKLFSVLTLLVALAATFFGFQSKELVTKLQVAADRDHTDLLDTRTKLKKTEKELADTKKELEDTKADLAKTKETLVMTQMDLTKAKTDLTAATDAQKKAEEELVTVNTAFEKFKKDFPGTPEEIAKAIADMKAKIPELEAKVADGEKEVATLKEVNGTLTAQKKETEEKIASQHKVIDRYQKNIMQKGVRGQVLAVNAGWGFCVLSIGDRQGAAANKVMIVARDGQAIGKVRIINVENSQSVADIIPSSFVRGAYVRPGDEVIYTGEDKVREEPAAEGGNAPAPSAPPLTPALPQP